MGMEPVRALRRWDMVASTNHSDYNSDSSSGVIGVSMLASREAH